MSKIMEWMGQIYAVLAVIPFLSFILIWLVSYLIMKDKKRSTRISIDVTTLLLLGSVYKMCGQTLSSPVLFWLVVLLLLLAAGGIGWLQNDKRGTIDPAKIFRFVWRIAFLIFSPLYFLLLFLGIVKYMGMT